MELGNQIQMLGSSLLVQPDACEEVTKGGIVIPQRAQERPKTGTVVATGTGKLLESGNRAAPQIPVGSKVLFRQWATAGAEVTINETHYVVMDESDIFAILK